MCVCIRSAYSGRAGSSADIRILCIFTSGTPDFTDATKR